MKLVVKKVETYEKVIEIENCFVDVQKTIR